jgi:excisionase family DNA binding protein
LTVEDIRNSPGEMLTARQIAEILGSNPDTVRWQAKMGTLPFPCIWIGNRVKFPKRAFLKWMEVEE